MNKTAINSLVIILTVFLYNPRIIAQDFSVTVTADDNQGNSYDLTIGFSPNATDGTDDNTYCSDPQYETEFTCLDEGYCSNYIFDTLASCEDNGYVWTSVNTWVEPVDEYAPPQPPPPAFDAAIGWNNDRFYVQIVAGDGDLTEHVFDILLMYDTNNTINLTWDNTDWADLGAFILQDAFGGLLGIDVDMTVENNLILTNQDITILKWKVTPTTLAIQPSTIPTEYALINAYPNPFNPVTTIPYRVAEAGIVNIIIYDMIGREVNTLVSGFHNPNTYSVEWNGTTASGEFVPGGVYFYRMTAGEFSRVKKVVLLK